MRNKMMVALAGTAFAATLMAASPAGAVTIFSDNFNRSNSNTVGNGWAEVNNDADDVAISSNSLLLRDDASGSPDAQASQLSIATTGYQNITLSFSWARLSTTDTADVLFVEWRAGSGAWGSGGTQLASFTLGGSSTSFTAQSYNLGVSANNLGSLQFRFRTNLDGDNNDTEGVRIDDVVLAGDLIPVPEPASLALLGTGLFGAGFFGRRRRKAKA